MRSVILLIVLIFSFNTVNAQIEIYSPALPFTKKLNTRYYEKHPVMHPSGNMLFFIRSNDPSNIAGINDLGDIWYSEVDSIGNWSESKNIGPLVNDVNRNSIIGFLNNGSYMLIAEQYGNSSRLSPNGISLSEYRNGIWQKPVNIEIPYFVKKSDYISGSVSADGNYLILSLESYNAYGVEDLYISERDISGNWGDLKNLGKTINSPLQELTGYLTSDNKHLIFSSNRKAGIGSFDLWISTRKGNGWTNWTEPILLNDFVNSDGADFDFHYLPGNDYAFFTSTRNSDGYGDIKQVKITTDSLADKVTLYLDPNTRTIAFKITDAKSKKPLSADISVEYLKTNKKTEKKSTLFGEAKLVANNDDSLLIIFDKTGYLPKELIVNMSVISTDSIFSVLLEPLEIGNKVRLDHILFERATNIFLSGSEADLELLLKMMIENPKVAIFLEGHTDSYGNKKSNLELSQERVDAVKDYLVERGISSKRIDGKGYGGSKPIADNSSQETRKLNRRVEFRVTAN